MMARELPTKAPGKSRPAMLFDLCKNPGCAYRNACPLRPVPRVAAGIEGRNTGPALVPAAIDDQPLIIEEVSCCPIGVLVIESELTDRHVLGAAIAADLAHRLVGLLVWIDTPGGATDKGDAIADALRTIGRRVPVVASVSRALSSGCVIASACGHVVADGGAVLGGFGVAQHLCDGEHPLTLISRQSPYKWSSGPPGAPCRFYPYSGAAKTQMQASIDSKYEQDLSTIARWRHVDPEALRPILDGRTILARTGLVFGLVDAIGDEAEARRILNKAIAKEK